MRAKILVVDDEPHIRDVVRAYLEREGYEVAVAASGSDALREVRDAEPDLVVLDVMLPDVSGFDVLRTLRDAVPDAAVLMLTARDDAIDRVAGLEIGADDYVVKPFQPREVVARVGAILRRIERAQAAVQRDQSQDRALQLLDLSIDVVARIVSRATETLSLTRTEFDLIAALAAEPGRVWTREQLGESVFGEAFTSYDRSIDSHVKNLRQKLGTAPDGSAYVETVRGVGYRAAPGPLAAVAPEPASAGR